MGPGSSQFHVTLNENCSIPLVSNNYKCQNLNYLQADTSIDITEHHLYDSSKAIPRRQLSILNNVSQKLPEIDVEVVPPPIPEAIKPIVINNNIANKIVEEISTPPKEESPKEKKIEEKPPRPKYRAAVDVLPKKLDSSEIRKKYNIGSQISILKKPNRASTYHSLLQKACEDVPYLKIRNLKPEDLQCFIKIKSITPDFLKNNTAGSCNLKELVDLATSYYEDGTSLLKCKYCSRCFSTKHWHRLHEDEHAVFKFSCSQCDTQFMRKDSLEEHQKIHMKLLDITTSEIHKLKEEKETVNNVILKTEADALNETPEVDESIQLKEIYKSDEWHAPKENPERNEKGTPEANQAFKPIELIKFEAISEAKGGSELKQNLERKEPCESKLKTEIEGSHVANLIDENAVLTNKSKSPTEIESKEESKENNKPSIITEEKPIVMENGSSANKGPQLAPSDIKREIKAPDEIGEESYLAPEVIINNVKDEMDDYKMAKDFRGYLKLNPYTRCIVCKKICKNRLQLYQHCKFSHVPNVILNYRRKITLNKPLVKVETVNENFDVDDLEKPRLRAKAEPAEQTPHKCNICEKSFKDAKFLSIHMFVHTPTIFDCESTSHEDGAEVFICYICDKGFSKERFLKLHNLHVHLNRIIICKICQREFKSDFWYSRHRCQVNEELHEEDDETKRIPCDLCPRKFARLRFMRSHRNRMHKEEISLKHDSDSDIDRAEYEQKLVRDFNVSKRNLLRTPTKIQCDFCGELIDENLYDNHIFEHNNIRLQKSRKLEGFPSTVVEGEILENKIIFKCHICFKPFKRKFNLEAHINRHLNEDLDQTVVCKEESVVILSESEESFKDELDGDVKRELVEFYECCGKTFKLKAHYVRHYNIKHLIQKVEIDESGENNIDKVINEVVSSSTSDSTNFNNIYKRKLSSPVEPCAKRPKLQKKRLEPEEPKAKRLTCYEDYEDEFGNQMLNQCMVCGKKFKQKCQLRDHTNVHTGDKPYKCDFCNPVRGFTQTSSLYVHYRRVHAVIMKNCLWEIHHKSGECLICGEVFEKHAFMFQHMKDNYSEDGFECHMCCKTFYLACHYKVHNMDLPNYLPEDIEEKEISNTPTEGTCDSESDSSSDEKKFAASDILKCGKCDKSFFSKQQLKFHKKSLAHFQQIQSLKKQNMSSSNSENQAETIKDMQESVNAMIEEIQIIKSHRCNVCGRSFKKKVQLKEHKKIHKLEEPPPLGEDDELPNLNLDNFEEEIANEIVSTNSPCLDLNLSESLEESQEIIAPTVSSTTDVDLSKTELDLDISLEEASKNLESLLGTAAEKVLDVPNLEALAESIQDDVVSTNNIDDSCVEDIYPNYDVCLGDGDGKVGDSNNGLDFLSSVLNSEALRTDRATDYILEHSQMIAETSLDFNEIIKPVDNVSDSNPCLELDKLDNVN